jgi:penicillin amidase
VFERQDAWWCDNKQTREIDSCTEAANEALNRALGELQGRLGDDPSAWRWGDLHIARAEHRPFSKVGALAWLFELRTPVGGDGHTVNVSRVALKPDATTGELFLSEHGPSLRALYDVADPSKSRFMHSSGQSGIALSSQYRRFLPRWAANTYVSLWPTAAGADVLTLNPASK